MKNMTLGAFALALASTPGHALARRGVPGCQAEYLGLRCSSRLGTPPSSARRLITRIEPLDLAARIRMTFA